MNATGRFRDSLTRFKHAIGYDRLSPLVRKVIVCVLGGILVLVGLAMIVLPGPAVIVLPLGLAIIASEFPSVRKRLRPAMKWIISMKNKVVRFYRGRRQRAS